ncbi:MAG TPA: hypothetical protein VF627_04870 [Abditibacterium sp.]|jgi:hypothetical protein
MNPQNPNFISLESIHIATPCRANWNKMTGDDRARFCRSCAKNVYNLSAMSRAQAQRLILDNEGQLCIQLHRRADGTVITSDCPVGISPARKPTRWLGAMLAAIAGVLSMVGVQNSWASKPNPAVQMTAGAPMVMGEAPMIMGSPAVPKIAPTPKSTKKYANRARKSNLKARSGHRRHR